jgi:isocitrate lyase
MSDMVGAAGVSIMADPTMTTPVIADADTGFGGAPQVVSFTLPHEHSGL